MTPKQLKASILQLAIQGKLVPQDPNDEPASELLKRIEDAQNAKSAKKGKPLPPITDDEKPFSIPDSWEWVRLGDVIHLLSGRDLAPCDYNAIGDGMVYVTGPSCLSDTGILKIRWTPKPCVVASKGDVLLVCKGAGYGKNVICDIDKVHIARQIMAIQKSAYVEMEYVQNFLNARFDDIKKVGQGVIPGIGRNSVLLMPLPLPPFPEQKRIVAKVEALFKYVDECEDSRKQLAEKLSVTLKRSVLQEAIQGRLVPQDPNDEPASELLKRIIAERKKQIAEKKIKKQKPLPPITVDEKPFSLPSGWEWTRIGDVCEVFNGNSINEQIKKTKYAVKCDGYSFIATPDVGFDSSINYESGVYIPKDEPKFRIAPKGSALMCIEGGSAARKFGFLDRDVMFGNKLCCFVPMVMDVKFIYWYLQSITFYSMFQGKMTGIIGGVGPEALRSFLIPLPPLAEQKRIVAKVDSLLRGVGTLKNLYEVDAWILNLRIEKHKKGLCTKYNCLDIRFEAHKQDVSLQHPFSCAYMEVLYQRGGKIAVDALLKEVETAVDVTLTRTTLGGGITDEMGCEREIFQVEECLPHKQEIDS